MGGCARGSGAAAAANIRLPKSEGSGAEGDRPEAGENLGFFCSPAFKVNKYPDPHRAHGNGKVNAVLLFLRESRERGRRTRKKNLLVSSLFF